MTGGTGNKEKLVKGYNLQTGVISGTLLDSRVTIANDSALYVSK